MAIVFPMDGNLGHCVGRLRVVEWWEVEGKLITARSSSDAGASSIEAVDFVGEIEDLLGHFLHRPLELLLVLLLNLPLKKHFRLGLQLEEVLVNHVFELGLTMGREEARGAR